MGIINRIKEGLKKTRDILFTDIRDLIKGKTADNISAEFWDNLEEKLLIADVGVNITKHIITLLQNAIKKKESVVMLQEIEKELVNLLEIPFFYDEKYFPLRNIITGYPLVVMVVGVNGTGKTSFIAKLASYYKNKGLSVVLGAGDTYRAAAIEQLVHWAEKLSIPIVRQSMGSDSAAVAYDTISSAISKNIDVAIIDTAGRMHNKNNLIQELQKVEKVIKKHHLEMPQEKILILDATYGQNSIQQTKVFTEAINITSVAVTKMDTSFKAGFIFSITSTLGVPIKFITFGETLEDIQPFNAKEFVKNLLE
ncbi:MAG: signal recognition particle-docking protein FtsY [Candidatus Calescibacterium sp.]|nr:signal recognition particle-docking protein FtsY [Candidatus Calescibacterium sp.]